MPPLEWSHCGLEIIGLIRTKIFLMVSYSAFVPMPKLHFVPVFSATWPHLSPRFKYRPEVFFYNRTSFHRFRSWDINFLFCLSTIAGSSSFILLYVSTSVVIQNHIQNIARPGNIVDHDHKTYLGETIFIQLKPICIK